MNEEIKKINAATTTVDEWLEWGDLYNGDLPDLDPEDYDSEEEIEAADEERRRQYWRLTGLVATSRAAWEAWLAQEGVEKGSEYWIEAEKVAERFRDLMDDEDCYWPIDAYISYERGDGCEDDSIEGAGSYNIMDL